MLRSVCLYALCIAGAKHESDLTFCSCRFLFGECKTLCYSVFPLQPFQCSWYYVFDMDPIKDAPRKALCVFWNRFLIEINKHRWSMRWIGLVSCLGPMRPHVFAIRLFVWVCLVSKRFWCVSSLCWPTVVLSIEDQEHVWEPCCKSLQG